jgi:hypothetical protein
VSCSLCVDLPSLSCTSLHHADVSESIRRFVNSASYSLLHIKSQNNFTGNISNMAMFLEMFVEVSSFLHIHIYTLLF